VIRERGYLDIMDLAIRVIRSRLLSIAGIAVLGVLPFGLFNHWLLGGETAASLVNVELLLEDRIFNWVAFVAGLTVLVLLEVPLATAPLTLYLGQITFNNEFDARRAAGEFARSLPQLFVLQGVGRALFIPFFITWFFPFVLWPYLNEIILLERSPLWRRGRGVATTLSRISTLHSRNTGDLLARAVANAALAPLLALAFGASLWIIYCVLTESWTPTIPAAILCAQIAIWMVAVFLAVVRFLAYLDLRIRNEGWELELRMRAEGLRIAPPVTA
jgi:hypothetical protein